MRLTSREANKIATTPTGINTTCTSQNADIGCKKKDKRMKILKRKKKRNTNHMGVNIGLHVGTSCCINLESENKIEKPKSNNMILLIKQRKNTWERNFVGIKKKREKYT